MAARAFVLLSANDGDLEKMAQTLRQQIGVKMVDILEKPYGAIVLFEAPERRKMADLTIQALAAVQDLITEVQVLTSRG